jgi:tRNA 2-thiocytidine biosynthesis protein TtcA
MRGRPLKHTLGCLRKADDEFGLIRNGDAVVVGLSGGKDSLLLLHALTLYRRFSHKDYRLCAITVHPGLGFDPAPLTRYCASLGVAHHVRPDDVVERALQHRREGKTPCALCARMRRAALCEEAKARGYDMVALAHHRDDALETFWMSMFMEGRLNTLPPKSHLDRTDVWVIRPFLYLGESHIKGVVRRLGLPVQPSPCPFDGHTMRDDAKAAIAALRERYPRADERMFDALRNTQAYNLWDKYRVASPPAQGHVKNPPADADKSPVAGGD